MVEIKREGKKIWLDLDPYYPPKFKQPVTDFKAIEQKTVIEMEKIVAAI